MSLYRSDGTRLALCLLALIVSTAPRAEDMGVAKEKLVAALSATAEGRCLKDLMSPLLLEACEQQLVSNRRMLAPLGKIKAATYQGMQDLGSGGRAEAYRVNFENGVMTWIASLDSDGKLLVLWSSGEIRPK